MISKGEFTYKVGGEEVKVEDFYKKLLETKGDVHINELEMNLVPKNTPFFMDEVVGAPQHFDYWKSDSTVGSVYEKIQDTPIEAKDLLQQEPSIIQYCYDNATKTIDAEYLSELCNDFLARKNPQDGQFKEAEVGKKESQIGIKQSEGKLHYELSWEFIEEMAKRMANNKSNEYPLYNWKLPMDIQKLKDAINRHHIEVMKGNYKDGDEPLGHIVQYACNSMMLWHQLSGINE